MILQKQGRSWRREFALNVMILDTLILWIRVRRLRWLHSWKHNCRSCGEQQDPVGWRVASLPVRPWRPLAALENINLEVLPGELLCIVGPSGCGKSHCFISSRTRSPSAGEIWIDGRKVEEPGPDVSFSFRSLALSLAYGTENVEFGLRQKG